MPVSERLQQLIQARQAKQGAQTAPIAPAAAPMSNTQYHIERILKARKSGNKNNVNRALAVAHKALGINKTGTVAPVAAPKALKTATVSASVANTTIGAHRRA